MSGTMEDPFFVKLRAVYLTEDAVFQDSFTAKRIQCGNKKAQWPKRHHSDDCHETNEGQLEVHQAGPMMDYVVAPGCCDHRASGESNGGEGGCGQTQKAEPPVFVRMSSNQLQIPSGQFKREERPQQPIPQPETPAETEKGGR